MIITKIFRFLRIPRIANHRKLLCTSYQREILSELVRIRKGCDKAPSLEWIRKFTQNKEVIFNWGQCSINIRSYNRHKFFVESIYICYKFNETFSPRFSLNSLNSLNLEGHSEIVFHARRTYSRHKCASEFQCKWNECERTLKCKIINNRVLCSLPRRRVNLVFVIFHFWMLSGPKDHFQRN